LDPGGGKQKVPPPAAAAEEDAGEFNEMKKDHTFEQINVDFHFGEVVYEIRQKSFAIHKFTVHPRFFGLIRPPLRGERRFGFLVSHG